MLAIIPARGGSKRIPGKNIKPFLGHPVIEYSIRAALDCGCFSRVMVSTDSEEIADVARRAGAWVPFLRSEATANDYATTADVVNEVLDMLHDRGEDFDRFAVIYATAPFITAETLRRGAGLLEEGHGGAFTCVEYSYPVQRALVIRDGLVSMAHPEYLTARSQDLEKHYHDAGQCYFSTVEAFRACGSLWGPDTAPILLDDLEVQDIDTPTDWKLAELKYKLLHPAGPAWESDRKEGLGGLRRELKAFRLTPYQDLDAATSERMRQGRNLLEVRERMVNTAEIGAEEHARFVESLPARTDLGYYALSYLYDEDAEPELLGTVTLHDMGDGTVERGIWLFPDKQGYGYARSVMALLYDALKEAGYNAVYTRVKGDNESSQALDRYMGVEPVNGNELPAGMGEAEPEMVYFRYTL